MKSPQQQPLKESTQKFSTRQPPSLTNRIQRPWRGIFLAYFLFFCGLLFSAHGIHRYSQYSVWDLIAVWTLSFLLIIPGLYFGIIILLVELKGRNYRYKNFPELYM